MFRSTDEDLNVEESIRIHKSVKEKKSKSVKEKKSKSVKEKIVLNLNQLSTPQKIKLSPQAEIAIEALEQRMSGGKVALFLSKRINEPIQDYSH
jgi:hypothetical protein